MTPYQVSSQIYGGFFYSGITLNDNGDLSFFILFFETVLGREHSGKVNKNFIGNFYFWGINLSAYQMGNNTMLMLVLTL